ncbi:ribosome small subunit-dependent GTPase A [Phosphitispora fastidiosa]|uniref:ribosome small subunit-dependent GTPase A n=1 Tax=Phosphitispora fastidiosa TaxID=2837202 RepID=UPI001E53B78E|nr:ribosome small subunit-dependent GTPase A [Phosphitispora fastidiosa]MBU7006624.1 ribosome biogenesis GTPase [Phosphitispora fastidiosa]
MQQGTVVRAYSGFYYVEIDKEVWECRLRGKFRLSKQTVLPGDRVKVREGGKKTGVIEEILPRTTVLDRPQVANVDQVVIVMACADPDPQTDLLDRLLVQAEAAGLLPIICFNKTDLVDIETTASLVKIYIDAGYKVLPASAKTQEGITELRDCLKGHLTVFAGPSGAGKSSLLNVVHSGFGLKTGRVSRKIGRGRHTTRYAELLELDPGSLVVDSPGFSSLYIPEMDRKHLGEMFPEFLAYIEQCRFNGCLHRAEPDCAVKQALHEGKINPERYQHYLLFLEELDSREKRY